MPAECIFCQIFAGESPASAFYEDDVVLGLMTIGPVTTGHAMVIPRRHAASLSELDEETGRHLWTVAQRTAEAIRSSGVRCEGVNLRLADGEVADQEEVPHARPHVIPRCRDGETRKRRRTSSGTRYRRAAPPGLYRATALGLWRGRLCAPGLGVGLGRRGAGPSRASR